MKLPNEIEFFNHFFKFSMIRFDQIELATYLNKPLYPMDFKAKEVLNSNSVQSSRIMKHFKK